MKNKFSLIIALSLFISISIFGKEVVLVDNLNHISVVDSIKRPAHTIGGGILLMPIILPKPKQSNINYTTPLIVTGMGVLLISSSIKRSQTDWYNTKIIGRGATSIDDYLAFGPNALVFGLNFAGVKAKHNFKDRLIISTMANAISMVIVNGLKYTTKILRPDNSSRNSFPSGHTAFAFTGSQIIHEEYGQNSIAYSIGGYGIGAAVGALRMTNNRHWLSDVVAGAGIGMLSTKLAYRMLPWAQSKIYKNKNLVIMPMYMPKGAGLSMNLNLK